jgi:uncharacterized membrane protein HdeD (DUF308 family)
MRGGAIPLLAWGTVLLVLYAINWVWEGRAIQIATTVFAILVIYAGGVGLRLRRRDALEPGPPPLEPEPEPLPVASLASVVAGLSIGMILFGLAWSRFLVYFGVAVLLTALGRLAVELRAERVSRERSARERTARERTARERSR